MFNSGLFQLSPFDLIRKLFESVFEKSEASDMPSPERNERIDYLNRVLGAFDPLWQLWLSKQEVGVKSLSSHRDDRYRSGSDTLAKTLAPDAADAARINSAKDVEKVMQFLKVSGNFQYRVLMALSIYVGIISEIYRPKSELTSNLNYKSESFCSMDLLEYCLTTKVLKNYLDWISSVKLAQTVFTASVYLASKGKCAAIWTPQISEKEGGQGLLNQVYKLPQNFVRPQEGTLKRAAYSLIELLTPRSAEKTGQRKRDEPKDVDENLLFASFFSAPHFGDVRKLGFDEHADEREKREASNHTNQYIQAMTITIFNLALKNMREEIKVTENEIKGLRLKTAAAEKHAPVLDAAPSPKGQSSARRKLSFTPEKSDDEKRQSSSSRELCMPNDASKELGSLFSQNSGDASEYENLLMDLRKQEQQELNKKLEHLKKIKEEIEKKISDSIAHYQWGVPLAGYLSTISYHKGSESSETEQIFEDMYGLAFLPLSSEGLWAMLYRQLQKMRHCYGSLSQEPEATSPLASSNSLINFDLFPESLEYSLHLYLASLAERCGAQKLIGPLSNVFSLFVAIVSGGSMLPTYFYLAKPLVDLVKHLFHRDLNSSIAKGLAAGFTGAGAIFPISGWYELLTNNFIQECRLVLSEEGAYVVSTDQRLSRFGRLGMLIAGLVSAIGLFSFAKLAFVEKANMDPYAAYPLAALCLIFAGVNNARILFRLFFAPYITFLYRDGSNFLTWIRVLTTNRNAEARALLLNALNDFLLQRRVLASTLTPGEVSSLLNRTVKDHGAHALSVIHDFSKKRTFTPKITGYFLGACGRLLLDALCVAGMYYYLGAVVHAFASDPDNPNPFLEFLAVVVWFLNAAVQRYLLEELISTIRYKFKWSWKAIIGFCAGMILALAYGISVFAQYTDTNDLDSSMHWLTMICSVLFACTQTMVSALALLQVFAPVNNFQAFLDRVQTTLPQMDTTALSLMYKQLCSKKPVEVAVLPDSVAFIEEEPQPSSLFGRCHSRLRNVFSSFREKASVRFSNVKKYLGMSRDGKDRHDLEQAANELINEKEVNGQDDSQFTYRRLKEWLCCKRNKISSLDLPSESTTDSGGSGLVEIDKEQGGLFTYYSAGSSHSFYDQNPFDLRASENSVSPRVAGANV